MIQRGIYKSLEARRRPLRLVDNMLSPEGFLNSNNNRAAPFDEALNIRSLS